MTNNEKRILIISSSNIGVLPYRKSLSKIIFEIGNLIYLQLLKLAIVFYKKQGKISVLTSRSFQPKKSDVQIFYYDDLVFKLDYQKINQIISDFNVKWHNQNIQPTYKNVDLNFIIKERLSSHLSYSTVRELILIESVIKELSPYKIVIISQLTESERLAKLIAETVEVKVNVLFKTGIINPLNKILLNLLQNRQSLKTISEILKVFNNDKITRIELKKNKKVFLFIVSRPIQLKTVIPIYKLILKKTSYLPMIFASFEKPSNYLKTLHGKFVTWLTPQDFISNTESNKIFTNQIRKFKKWWEQITSYWEQDSNINSKILREIDYEYLHHQTIYFLPVVTIYVEAAKRIFKKLKPNKILLFSEIKVFERSVAKVSQNQKHTEVFYFYPNNNLDLSYQNFDVGNKILVTGYALKKELLKRNVIDKKNKIFVVGDPRFDNLNLQNSKAIKNRLEKKYNFTFKKKTILLISIYANKQVPQLEKEKFFKVIYENAKSLKNITILVKPHPNESVTTLKMNLKDWGVEDITIVDKYENLLELIKISDTTAFIWSMTGFEVMAFGKPTIAVNLFNKNYDALIPYSKKKAVLHLNSQENARKILRIALGYEQREILAEIQKNAKYFLKEFIDKSTNSAAERVIEVLNLK